MAISKFNYNSFNVTPVAGAALAFDADADGFSTATSTSMTLIKTLTASASATISFVNGSSDVVLDDTYPVYKFEFINIHPASDSVLFTFNLSVDTGSNYNVAKTTTIFAAQHTEGGASASVSYDTGEDLAQGTGFQGFLSNIGNGNDECASGELTLFNPSSTTFIKHFFGTVNHYHSNDRTLEGFLGGYGNTTSAVDAVQFKMSSGNMDAGTIKLYGIKDS